MLKIQLLNLPSALLMAALIACGGPGGDLGNGPSDPGREEIVEAIIRPDDETFAQSPSNSATVRIPARAVDADTTIRISDVSVDNAPTSVTDVVSAIEIHGVEVLREQAIITFSVPSGLVDPEIMHWNGTNWSTIPSWYDDEGALYALVDTFAETGGVAASTPSTGVGSILALVSQSTASCVDGFEVCTHRVPGFEPSLHGVAVGNYDGDSFRAVGVGFPECPPGGGGGGVRGSRSTEYDSCEWGGVCYGMAKTSGLFAVHGVPTPVTRSIANDGTFGRPQRGLQSLTFAEFIVGAFNDQMSWGTLGESAQNIAGQLRSLTDNWGGRNIVASAETLYAELGKGRPQIIGIINRPNEFFHAVLAFEASKVYYPATDRLQYRFELLDSNGYYFHDGHHQLPGSFEVTIFAYEHDRRNPLVPPNVRVTWDIVSGDSFDAWVRLPVRDNRGPLPWTNPELQDVTVTVNEDDVIFAPAWSHASSDATIARFAWKIDHADGSPYFYEFSTPAASSDWHTIARSRFDPGDYVLQAMAEDAQGNWSNAHAAAFTIGLDGVGFDEITRETIAALDGSLSNERIDNSDGSRLAVGQIIMYATRAGRYGKMLILENGRAHNDGLRFNFVTYGADGAVVASGADVVVPGTWDFDLDSPDAVPGQCGGVVDTCDFWLQNETATARYMVPLGSARFFVLPNVRSVTLSVVPSSVTLQVNETQSFSASVTGASDRRVLRACNQCGG